MDTVVGGGRGGERVKSTGVARVLEPASDMAELRLQQSVVEFDGRGGRGRGAIE